MAFLLPLDSFFTIFNNMITFKEYSELVPVLNQWTEAYAAGNPIVEDNVYDKEYIKLKEFEAANPDLSSMIPLLVMSSMEQVDSAR